MNLTRRLSLAYSGWLLFVALEIIIVSPFYITAEKHKFEVSPCNRIAEEGR